MSKTVSKVEIKTQDGTRKGLKIKAFRFTLIFWDDCISLQYSPKSCPGLTRIVGKLNYSGGK
jgi:hypothetical protein